MKTALTKIIGLILPALALFLVFGCTKDTDLLTDYVLSDAQKTKLVGNLVRDDIFVSKNNGPIILDVLSNDDFDNPEKVKIVEISSPSNGSVILNEDKTLTYTPAQSVPETSIDNTDLEKEGSISAEDNYEEETPSLEEIPSTDVSPIKEDPKDGPEEIPATDVSPIKEDPKDGPEEIPATDVSPIKEDPKDGLEEIPATDISPTPVDPKTETNSKTGITDTFTYTTETENEDKTVTVQTGTVTITDSETNGGEDSLPNISIPSDAVKASSFGYRSGDATAALKAAINSRNGTIVVDRQSGDWIVGPLNFVGLRNKTIIFEEGVVLRSKSGAYRSTDRLFQLVNSSNVEIIGYGATFKMNQAENNGEQNHVLSIVSSSNITVKGLTLRDGGGDGLYISRYGEDEYCSNIRVEDIIATNNRRQGMSIISVDGLYVGNSTFSGSNGKSPGAGVDLEPESIRDRFVNVIFENCVFRDNYGPGLMIAVNKSSGNSLPLDINLKNSYFTNNSRSNPRAYPTEIELGMCATYRDNPIKGTITFDGLTVENSDWGAIYTKKTAEAYKVVVKNATIRNVSKASSEAAIHIGVLSYANTSTANMGGFTFQNVLIDYDGIDPSLQLFGPSSSKWNLKNMYGEIKVRSPKGVRFSDNMNKLATTSSSTVTLRMVKYE